MIRYVKYLSRLLDVLNKEYKGWSHSVLTIIVLAAKNVFLSRIEAMMLMERFKTEDASEEEIKFFNAVGNAFSLMPEEACKKMREIVREAVRS